MMILDFFGMPGSGKSTLAHRMAEELRRRSYRVVEPVRQLDKDGFTLRRILIKGTHSLLYSLGHPALIKKILSLPGPEAFQGPLEKWKEWVNVSYLLHLMNKKREADFLICDQGIAQAVVSLYARSSLETASDCYLLLKQQVKGPITCIYVWAPPESVMKRLKSRENGRSRADLLTGEAQKSWLQKSQGICELLAAAEEVLMVSNEGNLGSLDWENLAVSIESRGGK